MTPNTSPPDLPPDDAPEVRMPLNARMGAFVMVAIVLTCAVIALILVLAGGLGAVVWQ